MTVDPIDVFVTDATNVVIDINGYYVTQAGLPLSATARAPALTFGDPGTGLYADGAGGVGIATAGTGRLTVRLDGDLDLPGSIRTVICFFTTAARATRLSGRARLRIRQSLPPETRPRGPERWQRTRSETTTQAPASTLCFGTQRAAAIPLPAFGAGALSSLTAGDDNTAVAVGAGSSVTGGSFNVHIANGGAATDSNTIRIGYSDPATGQSRTFIAGIRGVITNNADAIPVVIDSAGQLGTSSSSRRVKRDIREMHDTTETILSLRPVEFRYVAHGPESPVQYGLIAEEVAGIAPELIARNKDGQIETVHYDKINAMLNEVQKLHRANRNLQQRLAELENRAK